MILKRKKDELEYVFWNLICPKFAAVSSIRTATHLLSVRNFKQENEERTKVKEFGDRWIHFMKVIPKMKASPEDPSFVSAFSTWTDVKWSRAAFFTLLTLVQHFSPPRKNKTHTWDNYRVCSIAVKSGEVVSSNRTTYMHQDTQKKRNLPASFRSSRSITVLSGTLFPFTIPRWIFIRLVKKRIKGHWHNVYPCDMSQLANQLTKVCPRWHKLNKQE